jgi:formate dehydrogenase subunit delta
VSSAQHIRLIEMANKIAANLAARGEDRAVAETAQHIVDYWDPTMRSTLLSAEPNRLSLIARRAVEKLSSR